MASPSQVRKDRGSAGGRLFDEISGRMLSHGKTFARKTMPVERMSGRPGLKVRTGGMRRTFDATSVGNNPSNWAMIVYTTSKQAPLQEYGGDIVPKAAKKLAIPLPAALTAAGVARGSPRSFPDTFIQKSKAGNLLIFQKKGDGIVPLFALKDRVTIPPRLGMFDTWDDHKPDRARLIERAAKAALDEGGYRG